LRKALPRRKQLRGPVLEAGRRTALAGEVQACTARSQTTVIGSLGTKLLTHWWRCATASQTPRTD
jgi:hypothetical protein